MQNVITNKINCTLKKGFEDTCTITASNIFFLGPNVAKDVVYTCYCRQRNVSLDSFFAFILLIKRTYVVAWTICSIHVCMSQPCMSEMHRSLVYSFHPSTVFFKFNFISSQILQLYCLDQHPTIIAFIFYFTFPK